MLLLGNALMRVACLEGHWQVCSLILLEPETLNMEGWLLRGKGTLERFRKPSVCCGCEVDGAGEQ